MPEPIVVNVSLVRVLMGTAIGMAGVSGGLFLIVGPGTVLWWGTGIAAGLGVLSMASAIVRGRPRLVVNADGFVWEKLFGADVRAWSDIAGEFVPLRIGMLSVVAYRLTDAKKAADGRTYGRLPEGYDGAVGGNLSKSTAEVAELLNACLRASRGDE